MNTITCAATGKIVEAKPGKSGAKLPRGWKRYDGQIYSPEAWHDRYVVRAVVIPIASPVVDADAGPQSETGKSAWQELNAALADAWGRSTRAANWGLKELLKNDVTRTSEMKKSPKMPPIYLYGLGKWDGWASSANAILRLVEQKYRALRYEIVWLG